SVGCGSRCGEKRRCDGRHFDVHPHWRPLRLSTVLSRAILFMAQIGSRDHLGAFLPKLNSRARTTPGTLDPRGKGRRRCWAAYVFTTAERARDMRQSPVYVLNQSQHNFRKRSTQEDLDEIEDWTDRAARRMYEGAGLGPEDVDVFNPYDGYAPMAQFFLEAFQWHGVKRGDAFAFYAGDIRVEGPHPFCSSG